MVVPKRCVCMLSCVQLFVTPWTVARPAPVHGILQTRILEWVAMPSSRGSSPPRDQTPWTVAHQASLCMRFLRQRSWDGLPFPPPGELPSPGIEPVPPASPALAGGFFTTEPPGTPPALLQKLYPYPHPWNLRVWPRLDKRSLQM